jgi:dipeptidyl aminopeptidase/acylaminoacyl peptidase
MLALAGLLVAALLTFDVYRTWTPGITAAELTPYYTSAPADTLAPTESGPTPTPAPVPSATIATNPEIAVPGTLVYVRDGSLWVQSGTTARQITEPVKGSRASQPAFSPDGQWIYYIDTRVTTGRWYDPNDLGAIARYTLYYPVLCRIHPDGTGQKDILPSLVRQGALTTFFWIRQPSVSATGYSAAVVSDGPTFPGVQDMGIHYVSLSTGKMADALPLRENSPLGLSDPRFSPDGNLLAYTMEGRSGSNAAPSIWIYDARTGVAHKLAGGYRAASWSPDGKDVAATGVSGSKLDVVVLDATSGKPVAQVTSDGASWGPVWSPAGDQLVYMHLTGAVVDLNMVYISGSGANLGFEIEPHLTEYSGLDGGSPAAWYIPGYGAPPSPSPVGTAVAPTAPAGPSATPR